MVKFYESHPFARLINAVKQQTDKKQRKAPRHVFDKRACIYSYVVRIPCVRRAWRSEGAMWLLPALRKSDAVHFSRRRFQVGSVSQQMMMMREEGNIVTAAAADRNGR